MQDTIPLPACFASAGEKPVDDPAGPTKSGQSMVMSVYQTKIAGQCRCIAVTWCKNLLVHGLSISVDGGGDHYTCKVELRPWYFWRKQGSKRFFIDGTPVDVFWDLKAAKFAGEPEPISDYFVALISDEEVVLLLGDLKKEAYRRTGARPSLIDAILISKKEHVFAKKKFSTRAKFHERGKLHEITIECSNGGGGGSDATDPEMAIRVDGHLAIQVKHLHWKFRGNGSISINKVRIEVYWDVHDWLFSPGLRHALFIFKPIASALSSPLTSASSSLSTPSSQTPLSGSIEGINGDGSSGFCLFLYAWKLD